MHFRLINWNVSWAKRPGPKVALLREVMAAAGDEPVVVVLQEVKPEHREAFASVFDSGATVYSLELRSPDEFDGGNRKLGVMLGTTRGQLEDVQLVAAAPYPDRTLAAAVRWGRRRLRVMGAHGLTGVGYRRAKPDQLRALARHVAGLPAAEPSVFALDANEPDEDAWAFCATTFHPNDDKGRGAALLLGPDAPHGHRDALRDYLDQHPEEAERMRAARPTGPLAPPYYTRRKTCRYDHCWVNEHVSVRAVRYHYQRAVEASSDHAMVVADLALGEVLPSDRAAPRVDDASPLLDDVLRVLTRKPIPPGQVALFKALRDTEPHGLTHDELAGRIRWGDEGSLKGVLGALGRRVNETEGFEASRPGTRFLVHRDETSGAYRALPILLRAIEALPQLEEALRRDLESIYAVRADPSSWLELVPHR
jgi:endonuclease/exonuclease/phosphatase family metal-dependent hydrolase